MEEVVNAGSLLQLQQGAFPSNGVHFLEKEIQQHMAGDVSPPWE